MKFTKAQMQFIKSKFPEIDEVSFAQEAMDFAPKKKVMKEVPENERCTATKKDGERCTKRHTKDGDKCAIHEKTHLHVAVTGSASEASLAKPVKVQCCATTKKNEQCKKNALEGHSMCSMHGKTSVLPVLAGEVLVA